MKYPKGSTIGEATTLCCQHASIIIPFFSAKDNCIDKILSKLPYPKHDDDGDDEPNSSSNGSNSLLVSDQKVTKNAEILVQTILEHVQRIRNLSSSAVIEKQNLPITSSVIAPSILMALHLLVENPNNDDQEQAYRTQLLLSVQDSDDNEEDTMEENDDDNWRVGWWEQDRLVKLAWDDPLVKVRLEKLCSIQDNDHGWNQWLRLLMRIAQWTRLVVEQPPHPLWEYASKQVPHLNPSQLQTVRDCLLQIHALAPRDDPNMAGDTNYSRFSHHRLSPLVVQKWIQDYVQDLPERLYVVWMVPSDDDDDDDSKDTSSSSDPPSRRLDACRIPHSCIPTAQWEVTPGGRRVVLTALYDIDADTDVTVSWIPTTTTTTTRTLATVEERDAVHQAQRGQSCHCLRCRYELSMSELENSSSNSRSVDGKDATTATQNGSVNDSLSVDDATQLARYYMSVGDWRRARTLYTHTLQQMTTAKIASSGNSNEMAAVDLCHVLGAIELTRGKFLNAQRIWQRATLDYPESAQKHPGLSTQLEKVEAYEYFAAVPKATTTATKSIDFDCPVPGVFVASVVDPTVCRQIVDWAETLGRWTQQRHYAVPTHDVPVHTVPPLLQWFQHQFMSPVMQLLLARQFGIQHGRFYVHDAFVVRYSAGSSSNHLPIHTDESTHSLVLALNDDYTGGGTYIYDHDTTVRPKLGHALSFAGGEMFHGGEAVTEGVRYILAVFLYHDDCEENEEMGTLSSSHTASATTVDALSNHEAGQRKRGGNSSTENNTISKLFRESKQQKTHVFSFGFVVEQP